MACCTASCGGDGFLIDVQSLIFNVVARDQLLGFARRSFGGQAGDHAEIVKRFIGLRLALRFGVVGVDGGGAGFLGHQVAVEFHLQALVLGFGGFHL